MKVRKASVMKKTQLGQVPVYTFSLFSGYPEIVHFSTTRQGGQSGDAYRSLNLGFHSGDEHTNVQTNRKILIEALGLNPQQLVFGVQTHSTRIARITPEILGWNDEARRMKLGGTDALITNEPNICIAVKTADCIPVLLYDKKNKAAAAIHAGWRGTVGRIVARTIETMHTEFGTQPNDLIAGIGPGIGPDIYQVGPEVVEMVYQNLGNNHGLVQYLPSQNDKRTTPHFNLWKANLLQLIEAGLYRENIEVAELCTFSHPEDFFSARRDGTATGRMASGIMITK